MPDSVIYRYQLDVTDAPSVEMPEGASVLSCAPCRASSLSSPCVDVWARVDPAAEPVVREFRIVGTGNPIRGQLGPFVGTFALHGGAFIGHLFEATTG